MRFVLAKARLTARRPAAKITSGGRDNQIDVPITAAELESAIKKAVKIAPGCKDFIGVVVQPITAKSRLDPNWEVRGVRFGNADRKTVNEYLAVVVVRLQQEFRLPSHNNGVFRLRWRPRYLVRSFVCQLICWQSRVHRKLTSLLPSLQLFIDRHCRLLSSWHIFKGSITFGYPDTSARRSVLMSRKRGARK
jgi:hypothetical protein